MRTKACPVVGLKAVEEDGAPEGTFEAIVSAFGNVDSYGDVVVKGAFADTLTEWDERGDPIPVIWSHMSTDPDFHIGWVEKAEEREQGLWVRGRLDLDSPKAAQVFRLLKGRRVTQFSFAFDVLDAAEVVVDGKTVFELRKLKLYEVGPCLIGVNQETELLTVKAAIEAQAAAASVARELKAGRTLSAKNEEQIRGAYEALGSVLATLGGDEGKARVSEPANDEDPVAGKSEEPTRSTPAVIAASDVLALELAL